MSLLSVLFFNDTATTYIYTNLHTLALLDALPISSRNFAALAPFHTYPAGRPKGNHWGPAIAMMKTAAQALYYFNFHVGDLGHTLIIGYRMSTRLNSSHLCATRMQLYD